ncbi:hypothetical protein SK355_09310 [Candidatus Fukatsuia symbiotica]|nr:hypothetical protein [Candidatus Fukatsuia symbiotica]MEA9445422.1 hypothetical protein [Candidatus Fukatsuia symbiotica]
MKKIYSFDLNDASFLIEKIIFINKTIMLHKLMALYVFWIQGGAQNLKNIVAVMHKLVAIMSSVYKRKSPWVENLA